VFDILPLYLQRYFKLHPARFGECLLVQCMEWAMNQTMGSGVGAWCWCWCLVVLVLVRGLGFELPCLVGTKEEKKGGKRN
jgi:hypothetical protein